MLIDERYRIITQKINTAGSVTVAELAQEFNVSEETIRRDINTLDKNSVIRKVRGGAVCMSISKNVVEDSYIKRIGIDEEQKSKIGRYGAGIIQDNDTVFLDVGTTIDEIAKNIYGVENVAFITNSISALNILMSKRNNNDFTGKIYFLGGEVSSDQYYTTGETVLAQLENFWADKVFFSATSISSNGVYDYNVNEAYVAKKLLKCSTSNYCLVTSNKFNTYSLCKIADLNEIENIITDSDIPIEKRLKVSFEENDIKVHIVGD